VARPLLKHQVRPTRSQTVNGPEAREVVLTSIAGRDLTTDLVARPTNCECDKRTA
jgi:hypothetical protein